MKIAVTGASGFIGRYVIAALASRGVEVLALSRRLQEGSGLSPNVRWRVFDLDSPETDTLRELAGSDGVIHLAWEELRDFRSPAHFERLLPMHYRFLKSVLDAGLPRLYVAGTCLEYGLQSGCLDERLPAQPVTAYGYAKAALYRQLDFLKEQRGFGLTWARLFYLYGEGQPANTLYSQVRAAIAKGVKRFPMSPGEQLRDYLHVEEAAELLVQLVLRDCDAGLVNLCSGKPVSVRSLVERWFAEAGVEIELDRGAYDYPSYEPLAFWGDRRKLDHMLNTSALPEDGER